MAGLGTMSAGLGPFGLGTPVSAADPPTGTAGSRYLNPATRDFEQDQDTKQLAQMPRIRQRVLLAVMTVQRSSTALQNFGIKIPRKVGPSFEAEITASVRDSLRQMTETEKVIRIDDVVVERGLGGRQRITVSYTDISTGLIDSVTT